MAKLGDPTKAYVLMPGDRTPLFVPFQQSAVTHTNHTQAEQFYNNNATYVWRIDLSEFEEVRLNAMIFVGSASPNTPRIRLRYRTTFSGTVGDYSDVGTSEVATSLVTGGSISVTSGWIPLVAAAKADVFLALTQLGGDADKDPATFAVSAGFR